MLFLSLTGIVKAQADFVWGKQFGSDKDDKARDLVIDSSNNIYVVGKTNGLIGKEHFGKNDAFIAKIDGDANSIWTKQFGSSENDEFNSVTTDKYGNIYATGITNIVEKNNTYINQNILVVKLSADGELIWQKHYGTDKEESGSDIVVDKNGDVFVVGNTKGAMEGTSKGLTDCFILHLNSNGDKMNTVQLGTPGEDFGNSVVIGNDRIYVCGSTTGNMVDINNGEYDMFWGSFSKKLKQQDMKQYGTNKSDHGKIEIDDQNKIYVMGSTFGDVATKQKGNGDAFIQKWNTNGELNWTKQFGTHNWDGMHGIAILPNKGVVVSGCFDYPLCKSFIKMFDENGTHLWDRNIVAQGKGGGSCGKTICTDGNDYIYHVGYTGSNLFSELKGKHDLFLVKLKINAVSNQTTSFESGN